MATISFLNDTQTAPGLVTRGLFGRVEQTDDPNTVRFMLDPRLINVCTGMGTGLVNGATVRACDVCTIEVPDALHEALLCSISIGLLRNWAGMYLKAGMPQSVLETLSQDARTLAVATPRLDLRSSESLMGGQSRQTMLTYDFMNAAKTVVEFIRALRQEVKLSEIPVNFSNLAYQYFDEANEDGPYEEADVESQRDIHVYVGQTSNIEPVQVGVEVEQIESLLKGGASTVVPDSPIQAVPDDHMLVAAGAVKLFMPRAETLDHVQQMLRLVCASPLRSILLSDTTSIQTNSIRQVPRATPPQEIDPVAVTQAALVQISGPGNCEPTAEDLLPNDSLYEDEYASDYVNPYRDTFRFQ